MVRRLFRRFVPIAGLLACVPTAHAEVKDSTAGGFTVENAVSVPVDANTAWKALVRDVDKWWPKSHTWFGKDGRLSIDATAGGCFCERHGARQAMHLTVGYAEPGKLLRMVGALGPLQGMGLHGVLEFRFAPDAAGGTTITMFYRAGGYTPDDLAKLAPIVDRVQALQVGGLAKYLQPKTP